MTQAESTAPTASPVSQGASLRRALGLGAAVAVVVGNVIGSGIFAKPGTIARDGGDFTLILSAWVIGGGLCVLGALCFAELATMLPRAGGQYVYLRETYGNWAAFLFGWNELLFNRPGSIGALSMFFVGSLLATLDWQIGVWGHVALAIGVIGAMAWVNFRGVVWGGAVQIVTTLVKSLGVAVIAATPFLIYLATGGGIDSANYSSTLAAAGVSDYGLTDNSMATRFGLVLLAVMWAYNGWHGVTPVAEEIRNPSRNIPWALFGGIGILIVLYLAANFAYYGALSMTELANSGEHAAERMAEKLLGPLGATIVTAIVMCSAFGAINANLLISPRVAFAMGRDGLFFRGLGRVHANYQTPAVAIVVQAVMAMALVVISGLLKTLMAGVDVSAMAPGLLKKVVVTLQEESIFTLLTNFVIFAASVFYMMCVLAVFILRRKHPDWPRPYRTWLYPLTPLLFLGFYAWFMFKIGEQKPFEACAGLALIGIGLPVHWAWQWRQRRKAA